jgi:hypothetical protein
MRRIRQHLTYANVMATIAVFLVLSGGTAVALSGRNTVFSDDIVNGQVKRSDTNDNLRLKCPGGTRYHEGACIETSLRGTATWSEAGGACFSDNRRLPDVVELESFRFEPGITVGGAGGTTDEWTADLYVDATNAFTARDVDEGSSTGGAAITQSQVYRCVAPPKR